MDYNRRDAKRVHRVCAIASPIVSITVAPSVLDSHGVASTRLCLTIMKGGHMKALEVEGEFHYHKPKIDPNKEVCICEHANTCEVEDSQCFHKNPHNLSKGALYLHPCKLPTYCRHRDLENVVCKTILLH
jgi:hypothetical protein